jgi:Fe-Mn family superoxide dismutase
MRECREQDAPAGRSTAPGTSRGAQAFALYSPSMQRSATMAFELKPLPFPKESLGPTMSTSTLEHHHEKHHAGYVKKLNELIRGTKFEKSDLESIIRATARAPEGKGGKEKKIFNNAAQVWNHDFFWESLAPNGGGTPPEPVMKRIVESFGSMETFRDRFVEASVEQFGSGWAWLVVNEGKLEIVTTHDADNPLTSGQQALWTCDLWEHAYYLDYQQERATFVQAVIDNVANWQFVGKRLVEADAEPRRAQARPTGS